MTLDPSTIPATCIDEHGRERHPPHVTLTDVWCRSCGVNKVDGKYLENKGTKSVVDMLKRMSQDSVVEIDKDEFAIIRIALRRYVAELNEDSAVKKKVDALLLKIGS